MGTHMTGGAARGFVVATDTTTEIGQVQAMLGRTSAPDTLMEGQLADLGRTLALISGAVCAGVFVLGLARGQGLLVMLKGTISLAVAERVNLIWTLQLSNNVDFPRSRAAGKVGQLTASISASVAAFG